MQRIAHPLERRLVIMLDEIAVRHSDVSAVIERRRRDAARFEILDEAPIVG